MKKSKHNRQEPPPRICEHCDGTGEGDAPDYDNCDECGGSGFVHRVMMECGACYQEYDVIEHNECPICGSTEIVGLR